MGDGAPGAGRGGAAAASGTSAGGALPLSLWPVSLRLEPSASRSVDGTATEGACGADRRARGASACSARMLALATPVTGGGKGVGGGRRDKSG